MVTRKPVPDNSAVPPSTIPHIQVEGPTPTQHEAPEPWETFDSDAEDTDREHRTEQHHGTRQHSSPNGTPDDVPAALRPGASSSPRYQTLEDDNVWVESERSTASIGNESGSDIERIPSVLRPGSGGLKKQSDMGERKGTDDPFVTVPLVLRPGGGTAKPETNPFKRKLYANTTGTNAEQGLDRSQAASSTAPPAPSIPLPSFSQLSLAEQSSNPWQPAVDDKRERTATPPISGMPEQDVGNDIWDSAKPSRQPTPAPGSHSPALLSLPSDEGSAGWEDESRKPSLPAPLIPAPDREVLEDSHAWDDLGNLDKGKTQAKPVAIVSAGSSGSDDWNLIDVEAPPGPPPKQRAGETSESTQGASPESSQAQGPPPALPPRRSAETTTPPSQPPRAVDKSETYQIKNINWHDATAAKNPRTSPILVQNANGPCPLVALVNALSLTTPANQTNTALVEALRSRERISLGLLLDAVFDELMSERRTNPDADLPDVAELYQFLQGLHTGMNVNPRFIPTTEAINVLKRTSLTHVHPTDRTNIIPGTFESTKEMALYATFSIPLIHGWLPSRDDAVYDAFSRQAASYEDAQNLLFREEELEDKLQNPHHQGITEEEGQIYQDILTIKSFLSISATQLTPFGLDVIRQSMKPGSVAILFRNDHFSTLYRHPDTLELLTLVTDAGYANHDEVVWESLVDVNGERAEFFSGDFRLVGGAQHAQQGHSSRSGAGTYAAAVASSSNEGNWTTVQGRHTRSQPSQSQRSESGNPPLSPTHEQEDRDLALALQLQEEEDERHRVELARRRRESQLSEQFIEQQGRPGQAAGNGNRGGRGGANNNGGRGGNTGSPITPTRRSSNTPTTIPITATSSNNSSIRGGGRGTTTGARVPPQVVRPLVPPAVPARTNRGPDDGLDDAPPSYEQASKQTPYVPPIGHPNHPASTSRNDGPGASSSSVGTTTTAGTSGTGRGRTTGPYPGQGGRQGIRPPGPVSGGRERERDCVVM